MKPFDALMRLTKSRRVKLCERDEDGCWVYLKSGWNNGDGGEHTVHEDTWQECWDKFGAVVRCNCDGCINDRKLATKRAAR